MIDSPALWSVSLVFEKSVSQFSQITLMELSVSDRYFLRVVSDIGNQGKGNKQQPGVIAIAIQVRTQTRIVPMTSTRFIWLGLTVMTFGKK